MSLSEVDYVNKSYPILGLVRELQDAKGYSHGKVDLDFLHDQKTRCPVHNDSSPSAKVYVESNSVYCFTCGESWRPVGLYADGMGVGFGEALRELLGRSGVATSRVASGPLGGVSEPSRQYLDRVWSWAHLCLCETGHYAFYEVMDAVEMCSAGEPLSDTRDFVGRVVDWVLGVVPVVTGPGGSREVEVLSGLVS